MNTIPEKEELRNRNRKTEKAQESQGKFEINTP